MKPDELKEIARKFTKRYYPDFSRRFDRIWNLFEDVPPNFLESAGHEEDCVGLGISAGADQETREAISGIAVFAVAYQGIKDKDSVSGEEFWEKMSIVPLDSDLSAGLQEKFEEILMEMLPSVATRKQQEKAIVAESRNIDEDKSYVVYASRDSGFGAEEYRISEEELHRRFLSRKEEFDIIVYKQNVQIKDDKGETLFIELYSSVLSLLMIFLKYKDEYLPSLQLYHCAWQESLEHKVDEPDMDEIMDNLRTGISSLRQKLSPLGKIIIPNAKRGLKAYTCKGDFSFCLVLTKQMDYAYTLQVD